MRKSLLTPKESSDLVLAAYNLQSDSNVESYLAKIEKILVDKLFESSETDRLLNLKSP
jgi:hypothetical protein